jgi:serine-type D-Ala-D-Ala carboxypeptidase (penicillin-binding protein 5/6)
VVRRLIVVAAVSLCFAATARATPPPVAARAFVVANAATGEILAERNAAARLPIASITKLMTVLVALEHLRPDEVVGVGPAATGIGGSTIHLQAGERLTVRDLLKAALIQSANDAADALAAAAAGGDTAKFVAWMNAKAQELDLDDTHFARPDGLDAPGHLSSARDVLRLARIAMRVEAVRAIVRERTDTIEGGRILHSWNDLLGSFPGLIGVKTGHTQRAGWCEVAAAQRSGYTIYTVILGSPNRGARNADLAALLHWGVSRFRVGPVIAPAQTYAQADPGWGMPRLALLASERLVRLYHADRPLVQRIFAPAVVPLPVTRGQVLGRIEVWEGRRLLGSRPLVAARSVSRPGLGGRMRWYVVRTLHNVIGFFS